MQCPSCNLVQHQLRQCTECNKVVCRGNNDISCYQPCLITCHGVNAQVDYNDFDDGIDGRFTLYQPPNNLIPPPQSSVAAAASKSSADPGDSESDVEIVGQKTLDQILEEKKGKAKVIDLTSPSNKRRNSKNDKDDPSGAANVGGRKSRRRRKKRKSKKRKSKKFRKSRKSRKRRRTRKKRRRRKN